MEIVLLKKIELSTPSLPSVSPIMPIILLCLAGVGHAATQSPQTPALVTRGCGPGDSWYRTELLVFSAEGAVARVEVDESHLKQLTADKKITFSADDAEFNENSVGWNLKNGMALFPCAVGQTCKSVAGTLDITAYKAGKSISGDLSWIVEGASYEANFSAQTWLHDTPDCM